MILKTLVSFLLLLVANFVTASKLSKFNFRSCLNNLKIALNSGGNIRPILFSFNRETSRFYSLAAAVHFDSKFYSEYISIKEEIICLLHNIESNNFKIEEIDIFNVFLYEELSKYEHYFSRSTLHIVLSFLIRASSRNILEDAKDLSAKLLVKLTPEQIEEFIKFKIIDFKGSSWSNLDNKIKKLSGDDQEEIFSVICQVADDNNTNIKVKSYEILAERLEVLDFDLHPDWLVPILDAFVVFFINNIKSSRFPVSVGHFLFSHKILEIMRNSEYNPSYSLLLYFVLKDREIFNLKAGSLLSTFAESPYSYSLASTFALCRSIQIINRIDNHFNEENLNVVVTALDNLILLKENNEFSRRALSADCENISSIISNFEEITMNSRHGLNKIGMKIVGMVGYLCHDLVDDEGFIIDSHSNIISGYGAFLLKSDPNSCEYVSRFIQDFQPKIVIALEYFLKKAKDQFIQDLNLPAVIKFIQLIPDINQRNSLTDRFCSCFISDAIPDYNRYNTIQYFEINDKPGVYMTSFLTFLTNYARSPSESQLPYLRDFYLFLKDSKLLTKTELMILENKFNGFKLSFKRINRAK